MEGSYTDPPGGVHSHLPTVHAELLRQKITEMNKKITSAKRTSPRRLMFAVWTVNSVPVCDG